MNLKMQEARRSASMKSPTTAGLAELKGKRLLRSTVPFGTAAAAGLAVAPAVQAAEPPPGELTAEQVIEMSLEELMSLRVTSVAGVEREWFTTPSAIDVISGDEVRASGFRSIADALRLAPGVFVGRTSSHAFSIGMRGFNGSLANKTLVLIDGRSVYDPLFGGTFWDVQDVLLEDLDRVEVVRGPGATLWGSNAVNGVISVTTKSAKDTQGLVVTGGVGTYERAFVDSRYGFQIDDETWMRVYGKWLERDELVDAGGTGMHDDWAMAQGGFRLDRGGDGSSFFTLQGDAYYTDRIGEYSPMAPVPGQNIQFVDDIRDGRRAGANLLTRFGEESESSGWSVQAYFDRTERETNVGFEVDRNTFDLDARHHFTLGSRHHIMWGVGARYTSDRTVDGANLRLDPSNGDAMKVSAFIQDTITLVPDRWFAMLGSKVSYNDYTGWELQPSARLWWTPNDRNTWWASVSRPVRIPSRIEEQGDIIFGYVDSGLLAGGPLSGEIVPVGIHANDSLDAERLMAYEAGYRVRASDTVSAELSVFYNDYDDLIYVPNVIAPWNNDGYGTSYGGELAVTWRPAANWTLEAAYSYVNVQIDGPVAPVDELNTPHNQAQLRSYLGVTDRVDLFAALYYVDEVPQVGAEDYLRLDVGLTWRVNERLELSVWGQDLLDDRHQEFSGSEVERRLGFYVTAKF